jgi:hypothetical protein
MTHCAIFSGANNSWFELFSYQEFDGYFAYEDEQHPIKRKCRPVLVVGLRRGDLVRYEFCLALSGVSTYTLRLFPHARFDYDARLGYLTDQLANKLITSQEHVGFLDTNFERGAVELTRAAKAIFYAARQDDVFNGHETNNFTLFKATTSGWGSFMVDNTHNLAKKVALFAYPNTVNQKVKRKNLSVKVRRSILERDCYRCVDCGRNPRSDPSCVLHVDHRIAVANGGSNDPSNLQTLCDWCNLGKKTDPDWKLAKKR